MRFSRMGVSRVKLSRMKFSRIGLLALAVVAMACSVLAQSPIPTARGMSSDHRYEVAATYTHVLTDQSFGRFVALNGFTASASAGVLPSVQVTGEVGSYSGSKVSVKSFLAGPQVGFHIYRFQPFIRGLFGLSHTSVNSQSQGSAFTIAAGGGLNFLLTDHVAIRALQADYYRPMGGMYRSADFLRLGFGISYQFGSR
jgi:hypothetical protein